MVDLSAPILVAVDFSPYAEAALVWAAHAARRLGAPLHTLHVVHDPAESPGYYLRAAGQADVLRNIREAAEEAFHRFLGGCCERNPEIGDVAGLQPRMSQGLPASRILEIAEEIAAGLIVMGSSGRTGVGRFLLGSQAERVVRMSEIPVTIVKAPGVSEEQD